MEVQPRDGIALESRIEAIVRALPETSFLRQYVIYASQLTDCNAAYHVGAGLTILAQTVHDDLHVRLGSRLHGNIYALAVGPSTNSRKTASVQIARELCDEALPGAASKGPGSYEGLIDSLTIKGRQLLLYEEFGQLLAASERSYLTPIKATLTSVYDGAPIGRELAKSRKRDLVVAQKPRLSIFGACTSGYLSRHSEPVDWTDGFFARFIILRAERARRNDFPTQDLPALRAWLVQALHERSGAVGCPPCLGIDPSANGVWQEWSQLMDIMYAQAPKEVAGAVGRANGHVLKTALLLAWDFGDNRKDGPWTLERKHLIPAMELIRIHLESVFKVGEELAGTPAMNDRQAVLGAINDTPTTLGQVCRRARLLMRRTSEVIETLLAEKSIVKCHMQDGQNVIEAYRRADASEQDTTLQPAQLSTPVFVEPAPAAVLFDSDGKDD